MAYGHIIAFALSVIDFLTEGLFGKESPEKIKFVSFASGVSVSYLLLVMLPEIYVSAGAYSRMLFLPILFAFGSLHIVEKYISQHFSGKKAKKEHHLLHSIVSFTNFFVVGFILVRVSERSIVSGFLLFIPIALHIIIDSLPKKMSKNFIRRAFGASSAFLGAITASFIDVGDVGNIILISLVGGSLLYIVIRESIPKDKQGKPLFFTIGLLLFTIIVLALWNVGI